MRVLVGCEYSGIVRDAFAKFGHDAWSCDLLPTESPGKHYQGDLFDIINEDWDLLIAHPECKFLTNTGSRWLHEQENRFDKMEEAIDFFCKIQDVPIARKAIENPVMHKYAAEKIGSYSQVVRPWQHGHYEVKAVCLWLTNLPLLMPTKVVGPPPKDKHERAEWSNVWRMRPGKDRGKNRARFFTGIADAMAQQWGTAKPTRRSYYVPRNET